MKGIILNHLKVHGTITSYEAIRQYHCTRLSHYIYLLRREGHKISSSREPFTHSITKRKSAYFRYKIEERSE